MKNIGNSLSHLVKNILPKHSRLLLNLIVLSFLVYSILLPSYCMAPIERRSNLDQWATLVEAYLNQAMIYPATLWYLSY